MLIRTKHQKQPLSKHGIRKKLKNNKNIVIVKHDKGNSIVILDRNIYDIKLLESITDKIKFRLLDSDLTLSAQVTCNTEVPSLRHIVSSIGTCNYKLATFLIRIKT